MDSGTAQLLRKALMHMLGHGGYVAVRVMDGESAGESIVVLEDDFDALRPFVQGAEVRILVATVVTREG